ncbi:hypothetical protein [Pinibacter aurantiacus]|uniref:Uncharacterized protein n=1 Tax=Pinibacter aurantiacus TaxID=2851599 RepID=A0A9E2W8C1_9BACT|nr:hypothetical protein [Pinibacter aurantiacus]MBV4358306.1 hypothetical protein [Pinibacter aurantiacus]
MKHTSVLTSNPIQFITSWFYEPQYSYNEPFGSGKSYWNIIKDLSLIKIEAIFNVFSFRNYYINVLFFSFVTFFGNIAFVKAYSLLFRDAKKSLVVFAAFLIPSALFWTSGLHKDGLLFMLMSLIVYQLALWMNALKTTGKMILNIALCILFIFLLRSYVGLSLIPAIVICTLNYRFSNQAMKINVAVLVVCAAGFFLSSYISPALDLPEWLIKRRIEFNSLSATTLLPYHQLENSIQSYLYNLPQAIDHGFLRPYLWDRLGIFYIPFALEIIALLALIIYYLFNHLPLNKSQRAIFCFGLFIFLANWLFLGYMVHIVGAVIRYKSIFLPFFVAPVLLSVKFRPLIKN